MSSQSPVKAYFSLSLPFWSSLPWARSLALAALALFLLQPQAGQAAAGDALGHVATDSAAGPGMADDFDLAKVKGGFSLVTTDGVRVSEKTYAGKYLLIYFGYTMCPDMCPTGLQGMSRAMDMLGGAADKVQPIFITVDPARDTAARLRDYLTAFHARIVGLRGTETETKAAAAAYQVEYEREDGEDEDGAQGDQEYVIDHNSPIFVISPEGKALAALDEETAPKKLVEALRKAGLQGIPVSSEKPTGKRK